MVKGATQRYQPGRRSWVKVRIHHAREAVVGAVTDSRQQPKRLVLSLSGCDGNLRVAGITHALNRRAGTSCGNCSSLVAWTTHGSPDLLTQGLSRWNAAPPVTELVRRTATVEVETDRAFEHRRWMSPDALSTCPLGHSGFCRRSVTKIVHVGNTVAVRVNWLRIRDRRQRVGQVASLAAHASMKYVRHCGLDVERSFRLRVA